MWTANPAYVVRSSMAGMTGMTGMTGSFRLRPEAFTEDPDRLAGFDREAKVLTSLNHGHICAYPFQAWMAER